MRFIRSGFRPASLVVLVFTVLYGITPFAAGSAEPEIQKKIVQLDQLRNRIKALQQTLDSAQDKHKALTGELRETERKIGRQARKLRVLAGSLRRQRSKLDDLDRQRQEQQGRLELHRGLVGRQIRAAYAMGRQERLKILLNQQDPALVSRVMTYYDYLNRARIERMAVLRDQLERLRELETEIASEETRLLQLQSRETEEKARLEDAQKNRGLVLESLDTKILDQTDVLRGLKQNEKQLQELLQELQRALADIPADSIGHQPFSSLKGVLPWPSKGRLSVRFGSPRLAGNLLWDGVVIAAPEGREVKAVHHGRVAFADWLRGFGLLMIIDHGEGYMTLYGHNQTLFKETGEWVEPGETVALVGSSGGRNNAGVYFGIRYKGKPVNPTKWCKKGKGRRVGQRPRGGQSKLG